MAMTKINLNFYPENKYRIYTNIDIYRIKQQQFLLPHKVTDV